MTQLKNKMLKKGKRGFTLTELAIVIAVIAILIAVLVPTFTSVITNARVTAAAENAHSSITAYTLETYNDVEDGSVIKSGDYYFTVTGGAVSTDKTAYNTTNSSAAIYEYDWQEDEDESLPVIYFTASYVVEHSTLKGFTDVSTTASYALAAEAAAVKADTSYAGTYLYATVTVDSNTLYFTLAGTANGSPASSVTYVATNDASNSTSSYTSSGSADTTTTSGYCVQLYVKTS